MKKSSIFASLAVAMLLVAAMVVPAMAATEGDTTVTGNISYMSITVPTGETDVILAAETADQSLITTTGAVTSTTTFDVTAVDKMEVTKAAGDAGQMVEWTGAAWGTAKIAAAVKVGSTMTTYGQTPAALLATAITIIDGCPSATADTDALITTTVTTAAGDTALTNGNWYKITITFAITAGT